MRRSTNPRSTVRLNSKNASTPNRQLPTPKVDGDDVVSGFSRTWSRRCFLQTTAAACGCVCVDAGGATLFEGAGCNVIALPGPDGALMIDGGLAANADALLAAVKTATRTTRIHTLINTHWHPEQVGANEAVGRAGGVIFAHEKTKLALSNTVYASAIFTERLAPLPEVARPTRTTRGDGSMQ